MLVTTYDAGASIGRRIYILDTHSGIELPLSVWCSRCGIPRHIAYNRHFQLGWSWFDALHTPVGGQRYSTYMYGGTHG